MILINEIFGPTIQGEGKSMGREVIFIRTSTCNLHCVWCDTPYTWDWKNWDPKKEIHQMTTTQVIDKVLGLTKTVRSVVISGGEPLIQQSALLELVVGLKSLDFWIEIETNGTQVPRKEMVELIDQINCSPKLLNSGNTQKQMCVPEALKNLASLDKTCFKFVVSSGDDIPEIQELVDRFQMKQVYLMPLGKTREELKEREEIVKQLCLHNGFIFTPRMHIEMFGSKRGV